MRSPFKVKNFRGRTWQRCDSDRPDY